MGLIALGIVLLGAFVAIERRVAQPMPPLARVVLDRTRGGAFLALAVTGGVVFLTYYLQQSLALSRVLTGLAFLPRRGRRRSARRRRRPAWRSPSAPVHHPGRMALAATGMAFWPSSTRYLGGVARPRR